MRGNHQIWFQYYVFALCTHKDLLKLNKEWAKSVLRLKYKITVQVSRRCAPVVFLVILGAAVVKERLRFIVAVASPRLTNTTSAAIIVSLSLRHIVPFIRVFATGFQRPLRSAHLMRCASELRGWGVGMLPHRVVEVARVVAVLRVSGWNHVNTLPWIHFPKWRQIISRLETNVYIVRF